MNMSRFITAGWLLVLPMVCRAADSAPAFSPSPGSQVEVREGNKWSHATFQRKEGRKLQIRYDDGTEEWVLPDRLRPLAGSEGTPAAGGGEVAIDAVPVEIRMDNALAPRVSIGGPQRLKPATRPSPTPETFLKLTPSPSVAVFSPKLLFVCPDNPCFVIGVSQKAFSDTQQIQIIDLNNPKTFEIRMFEGKHDVLGAVEGGRVLLTTPKAGDSVTLHLWEYNGQSYRPKANYTLISSKGGKKVHWASLQSPTRAIVGTDREEVYLVDFPTHHALTTFKAWEVQDSLYSAGCVMAVRNNGNVGLVRAWDCVVVSQFEAPLASFDLHVDPTGAYIAYATGGGGIRVLKAANGNEAGSVAGALRNDRGHFDLLSPETILVDRKAVLEVKTGMPLWEYQTPPSTRSFMLPSGQMLLAIDNLGGSVSMCLATLPDPAHLATVKSAAPSDFLLTPGTQIGVSGDLGAIFGGEASTALDIMKKVVAVAGHELIADVAHYNLVVTAAAGESVEMTFQDIGPRGPGQFGPPMQHRRTAPSNVVTVTLTRFGTPVWRQQFKFGGGRGMLQGSGTIDQQLAEDARPKAAALTGLSIPSYLAAGSTPDQPAALGACAITPQGFGPPLTPQQRAKGQETPAPRKNTGDNNTI